MKYHFAPDYLLNPYHKITVCLIGCGGTGSQVLSILGRMNVSLIALGHLGLHVIAYDDDKISEANVGRQLFSEAEIGIHKSIALISRFNRVFGTAWESKIEKFDNNPRTDSYNIYITCVDEFKTRMNFGKFLKGVKRHYHHDEEKLYWLDFGNSNASGQAILGSLFKIEKKDDNMKLPCFDDWAKMYEAPKSSPNTPSCSLAEALNKQDLLINSSLANSGIQLLWRLFREGKTPYSGVVINLDTLTSNPIKVK